MSTADRYRRFAGETRGWSARYEEWSHGVAGDDELLALLDGLPEPKRQPNLLFAAARYLGITATGYAGFRAAVVARWAEVRGTVLARRTQTNEAGRCAALVPVLAALRQPLALIEVGASAGLCLYPDRYSYRYRDEGGAVTRLDPRTGPAEAVMDCATSGPVPVPAVLPTVVWRAGIDLNPLDVAEPDTERWLTALVWPEQDHRRTRLAAAIDVVRREPPLLVSGDLTARLPALAARAPAGATLVVFHTSVLCYLDAESRAAFVDTVRGLDARWLSNESAAGGAHVVALDGVPVASAGGHGQWVRWGVSP